MRTEKRRKRKRKNGKREACEIEEMDMRRGGEENKEV